MYYETRDFNELILKMVSLDALGLFYAVQKDFTEETKWFSNKKQRVPFYKLQVIEYAEEESSEENRVGLQSESEESGSQE